MGPTAPSDSRVPNNMCFLLPLLFQGDGGELSLIMCSSSFQSDEDFVQCQFHGGAEGFYFSTLDLKTSWTGPGLDRQH